MLLSVNILMNWRNGKKKSASSSSTKKKKEFVATRNKWMSNVQGLGLSVYLPKLISVILKQFFMHVSSSE